jgi:hypothetical protein
MAALAIFQPWIWVGVDIGKFLIGLGGKDIFDTKITCSGGVLTSGWLAVCLLYNNGLNAVMD